MENTKIELFIGPFLSGKPTSRQSFQLYSINTNEGCVNNWSIDVSSTKTILFQLCEDVVNTYVKMFCYASDKSIITKISYCHVD